MTATASSGCAGLVLTGGASRRFGSPKAELRLDGVRLVDRVATVLVQVAEPVLEVGPGYSSLDSVRESPPGAGPLAAVDAGLSGLADRDARVRSVLVAAVDLPFVDAAFLSLLRDHPAAGAVVPRVAGRAQPLCARYPAGVDVVVRRLVAQGARAMQALLDAVDVTWLEERDWVGVASSDALLDVDTPDDAQRFGLQGPG